MNTPQRIVKRCFDIFFSALGLTILWPVILLSIIAARKDTGLAGIFSQTRIGLNGKPFSIYKVRSMESMQGANDTTATAENDPRITNLGRKLRRLKLDELPQLWNVLIGDMSFVGPRPDVPGYADKLVGNDRRLLSVRPGITGPATIKYRREETLLAHQKKPDEYNDKVIFPEKVRLNLEYIDTWSLRGDVRYLLMTIGLLAIPPYLSCDESGCTAQ